VEEQILRFVDSLTPAAIYPTLFLSAFVETLFPPYPGDTVTVFCSFAAARRELAPSIVLLVSFLGSYGGGLVLWGLGHTWREDPPLKFIGWLSGSGSLHHARELLRRYGIVIVVLSRFVPGVRSLIILAAGLAGMGLGRMLWAVAIAVAVWQSILVTGGYLVGMHWLKVVSVISRMGLWAAVAAALLIYIFWRRGRRNRTENQEAHRN
jgi:membrane protein DedA with SNARE-associated domain